MNFMRLLQGDRGSTSARYPFANADLSLRSFLMRLQKLLISYTKLW